MRDATASGGPLALAVATSRVAPNAEGGTRSPGAYLLYLLRLLQLSPLRRREICEKGGRYA